MSIKDKIWAAFPGIQIQTGNLEVDPENLSVSVSPESLLAFAKFIKEDKDLSFDFLRCLTGMDWDEQGLGVVYHLESTLHKHTLVVKIISADRENPELPSVCHLWKIANLYEREVYDFLGINFTNHPDLRRLFLRRDDWVGYPLRKDFDMSREINPLRMSNETAMDTTSTLTIDEEGNVVEQTAVLFGEDEYVINIGPQHPATHGVLRFRVSLEGEIIKKLNVYCGYIHRGIEKMCESMTYPQIPAYTERLDYLSAMQNRHAYCMCVEKALQIEIPERVQYIRTIMDELQRINSHLLFFSTLCMDLGALTAFFYGFRDREIILDILEETTGGRLMFNYNVIGGLQADIHPDFIKRVKDFITYLRRKLQEYHDIFTGNIITQNRMKGVGLLSREDAISFGATGGTGRGSGWACDVRKRHPYAMYGKVDFKEITYPDGDCYVRYLVRMDEIVESMHIIDQLIDNIPEGEYRIKTKPIIRLPEGCYYAAVEASRGEFGVYMESRGDKKPYRVKFRSTGLPLIASIETIARGVKIADLIAIGGTLDYIVPDIDR
ncbi:MAG: NADH-quinone oxidoreductase subunit D [Tannerella sp.]|jgi:NADH-quinone oxidoreductase subunit C/D|nr:NADH-quinone oxidoreductase subunit D [Tannerella sp.]